MNSGRKTQKCWPNCTVKERPSRPNSVPQMKSGCVAADSAVAIWAADSGDSVLVLPALPVLPQVRKNQSLKQVRTEMSDQRQLQQAKQLQRKQRQVNRPHAPPQLVLQTRKVNNTTTSTTMESKDVSFATGWAHQNVPKRSKSSLAPVERLVKLNSGGRMAT